MSELRERFEIREVIDERRVYSYCSSERRFADACIAADTARVRYGGAWVIVDAHEGHRVIYDSRLQAGDAAAAE